MGGTMWKLVAVIMLGAFSWCAGQGFFMGYQNYKVAKAERAKEAVVRKDVEDKRQELLKSMHNEAKAQRAQAQEVEEKEDQFGSMMEISALDYVNGKGMVLTPAQNGNSNKPEPEESYEEEEDRGFQENTMAKQALMRNLRDVERNLRSQVQEVSQQMFQADSAYRAGETSTYEQLLSKARLEQTRRRYIVAAMDEKIAIIKEADYLTDAERAATLESNQKRRDTAATELSQYAEVEQVLIERREEYEAL